MPWGGQSQRYAAPEEVQRLQPQRPAPQDAAHAPVVAGSLLSPNESPNPSRRSSTHSSITGALKEPVPDLTPKASPSQSPAPSRRSSMSLLSGGMLKRATSLNESPRSG